MYAPAYINGVRIKINKSFHSAQHEQTHMGPPGSSGNTLVGAEGGKIKNLHVRSPPKLSCTQMGHLRQPVVYIFFLERSRVH